MTTDKQRMMAEIATPKQTKELLNRYQFSLKKSLGQNFLVDLNILNKMMKEAELDNKSGVLEIGPGIGALTQQLSKVAGTVVAVEIDNRLIPIWEDIFKLDEHVHIVHQDILKTDLKQLFAAYFSTVKKTSVIANLPYYVTTPIIMKLLESQLPIDQIIVMIQREVADRMGAKPGGKDYGSLSIAVQYYCEPKIVTIVPHSVFIPQPNVDSAIIQLKVRKERPVEVADEAFFFEVGQASFAQRRKTIYNNLSARYFTKETKSELEKILLECGISPQRRAETLSIGEFAALSNRLHQESTK